MSAQPVTPMEGVIVMPAPPQSGDLSIRVTRMEKAAREIIIASADDYTAAESLVETIKTVRRTADEHHRGFIDAAHKAWKAGLAALKVVDEPLERAEKEVKRKMADYAIEQERIRREEQARIEAELRRQQEIELEKQVEEAEAAGASAVEVAAIVEEAAYQPAPVVVVPKSFQATTSSVRKTLKAQVTSPSALVKYIAEHPEYLNLLTINTTALNALVRAQGRNLRLPGVEVYEDATVAVRR